jgi:hypothetical protein
VKGVYYFLYDPNSEQLEINNTDITLYLDDYNYSNDQSSPPGRAFVDADPACNPYTGSGTCDTTSVRGTFTRLFQGADADYEILEMYGPRFKVIRLQRQLTEEQRLAVTYRARRIIGPNNELGPAFDVGGMAVTEGSAPDTVTRIYMKLLRAPASLVKPNSSTGFFRAQPFSPTRDLSSRTSTSSGQRIDRTPS